MNHAAKRSLRPAHFGRAFWFILLLAASLTFAFQAPAAWFGPQPLAVAPKWGRFEQSFKSSVTYANPLEETTLTVTFTSPLGETFKAYGFWDGGKVWRVRFSPNFPGKWKFHTVCSDTTNAGLHNISGEFTCTAPIGQSRFDHHGPVRVARDHHHFEHQDHTPFFWLADAAGEGATQSTPEEWTYYAQVRSNESFSVCQWIAVPYGTNNQPAAIGNDGHLQINLEIFRKLDAKVETLNRAGLLDAVTPFPESLANKTNSLDALPEEQTIALLRYLVARWGADNVVWMLNCSDGKVGRWIRIGRAVFGGISHAPVVINPGEAYWALEGFRAEPWVDALGYQSGQEVTDDAAQWMNAGPVTKDWNREPARPFINLAPPCENQPVGSTPTDPHSVRRAAYWSVLNTSAAGINYGGYGVWNWDMTVENRSAAPGSKNLRAWQLALLLPGAKQMGTLADAFTSIDFSRLRPAPELLAQQPGASSPLHYVAAARTEAGDLAVIYVPENIPVELNVKELPPSPTATWICPHDGQRVTAPATLHGQTIKFVAPKGCRDWLLLLQSTPKTSK
ncbi:MAG: hypothetical protein JWQ04_3359 [Pedosphaera sp.]|nr:hypothetical protein [Pedosphaera sp.]